MKKSHDGCIAACPFSFCNNGWRHFLAVSAAINADLSKELQERSQHLELIFHAGNHLDEDPDDWKCNVLVTVELGFYLADLGVNRTRHSLR